MSATVVKFPNLARRGQKTRAARAFSFFLFLTELAGKLRARQRARYALLAADDRTLADLGISRAQANFMAESGGGD